MASYVSALRAFASCSLMQISGSCAYGAVVDAICCVVRQRRVRPRGAEGRTAVCAMLRERGEERVSSERSALPALSRMLAGIGMTSAARSPDEPDHARHLMTSKTEQYAF
jgi:hypothetical protein